MLNLQREDFEPLEGFIYLWRWTNPKWNVLPIHILRQIHPLSSYKSNEIWAYIEIYFYKLRDTLYKSKSITQYDSKLIDKTMIFDASGEADVVRSELEQLELGRRLPVVVAWSEDIAVVTRWNIFCAYWSDFCYPVSDDVCIWPLSDTWCLSYFHDEKFVFGKRST